MVVGDHAGHGGRQGAFFVEGWFGSVRAVEALRYMPNGPSWRKISVIIV